MKIEQEAFLDFLGAPGTRFVIPVFQRVYSWNARQCEELWDDIVRAGQQDEPHFMGLVLAAPDAESWHGASQLDIIDGQQRMTTCTLLLVALRAYLEGPHAPVPDVPAPDELAARYLTLEEGGAAYAKLALSSNDRATLAALVRAGELPEEPAQRLLDNSSLFVDRMRAPGFDLAGFWRGLCRLQVACVFMDADDSPQLVFESLNSKGMPLSTADRVRNYLIASTSGDEQEALYAQAWLPLERKVASAAPPLSVSEVLHAWLASSYRAVRLFDRSEAYGVFKTCLRDEYGNSLEGLLAAVSAYADGLLTDEQSRQEALAFAEEWLAGKPENLVSEHKLFGD